MATRTLSRADAQRMAVRAALLDGPRPEGLLAMVRSLAMLRVELTSIIAPAAEHVAWTRLGPAHRPADTERALASGQLFERAWMLRPISELCLYLAGMRSWAERTGAAAWMEANEPFARGIVERIADEGPLTSREIPDEALVPWPSSGWTNDRNTTQMLECLHMSGRLAVVGRLGRLRIWDVAENVYPRVEEVPAEEALRVRSEQLLRACGVMRQSVAVAPFELHGLLPVGEPVQIEGVAGRWRADPEQLARLDAGEPFAGRTAVLSPFDRLMTDRARVDRLFDFDYTLEMYQPARTRRWGAFALPILRGERLVGKVDARSDRDSGRLLVHRIHEDEPFDRETRESVEAEIAGLADWLGLRAEVPSPEG